ncbi:hypothetical protein SS50377_28012 [Spironucleus salmonicida]|uniref:CBS and transmembrane domain-containing protein n=1 Tax=Spironucleus salmonicida TaxID=348837 RepID=V6LPB7_9EUKA|nr:hypothetical protein SS50377_28012 [Spironucleus salmonicida]|eukprot:EST42569.1 CBS and transmembrane domain-containing protein [Spironucleus salmonicida]
MPTDLKKAGLSIALILLLFLSSICSGLNTGLLGMSPLKFELSQLKYPILTRKLRPLLADRHLLLCALLIANSICMAAIPLLLDQLVGPALALVLSVSLLVIFGEILPQALCGKFGIQIGSFFSFILWIFIYCTFLGSFIFAKLLGKIVGDEGIEFYKRREIECIIEQQGESRPSENSDANLDREEVQQIKSVIRCAKMSVLEVMTPIEDVYVLAVSTIFNQAKMLEIYERGHSRILITEGDEICGVLHIKSLIMHNPEQQDLTLNREKIRKNLIHLDEKTRVYEALNQFQTGKGHLALVRSGEIVVGIVTLEDIMEAILCHEIYDEGDVVEMSEA